VAACGSCAAFSRRLLKQRPRRLYARVGGEAAYPPWPRNLGPTKGLGQGVSARRGENLRHADTDTGLTEAGRCILAFDADSYRNSVQVFRVAVVDWAWAEEEGRPLRKRNVSLAGALPQEGSRRFPSSSPPAAPATHSTSFVHRLKRACARARARLRLGAALQSKQDCPNLPDCFPRNSVDRLSTAASVLWRNTATHPLNQGQ